MAAWKEAYLDLVLIPVGVLFPVVYHVWLWRAVRRSPLSSTVGINAAARRLWLLRMMKENEKKAVLVVQSMRNVIMGSTLMATTAILFCTGVAAVLSSTYAVKKPLSDAVFGAHGEYMMALKYVTLLLVFLLSFLSHTAAICTINQATFLVNALPAADLPVTKDYIADVLERGFLLNLVGNRLFYGGVPLLLWIFGPVLACICSIVMIPILHSIDMVYVDDGSSKSEVNAARVEIVYESDDSVMQV
ncbi:uncharacterized protein LOC102700922 [Oryza brachyantha]|uniref:uncharacterized protein LOC102700922 n=1 Tax=Oryza brachyantha TaxID=4533 RepID=UPI001AD9D818|nr:uncharacterized protein LOC102700922 [Oryza brachyantha]